MRKGDRKRVHKRIAVILGWLFLTLLVPLPVEAAGNVHFGSASYRWERGTVNPLGVYVVDDGAVTDYEVCLRYDPAALRYVDGADSQEGDLIYLRGTGSEKQYKTMLHFEALQAGDTQLEVVWAVGKVASGAGGQEASYEPTLPKAAPITVYWVHSSRLTGIFLEGELLEGFASDVTAYHLEVPEEMEYLELSWETEEEGARVAVSDQTLSMGENQVTVTVQSRGQEQVYLLTVNRMLAPAPIPVLTPPLAPVLTPAPTHASGILGQEEKRLGENLDGGTKMAEPRVLSEPQRPSIGLVEQILLVMGAVLTGVFLMVCTFFVLRDRRRKKRDTDLDEEDMQLINLEDTVIRVSGVTMKFRMAKDEASSLKEYLIRAVKHQNQYSWLTALDNISFEVKQGDVLGIIGTNGSGKSTLLKIVSGALIPTQGTVQVDRSKVQMLTLGTGFDMELTARENVYLNGSIIGYTREYINEKYEDIVRFAELEGFMDERMKNFSSGMVSRLGFAIATMRDAPDILILDEVLSVGDTFFQKKSMKRIREMIHGGATVLIVSHAMGTIRNNCNKVVWIEKGKLRMVGDPKEVCAAYERQQDYIVCE